jgi:hypothetical protein
MPPVPTRHFGPFSGSKRVEVGDHLIQLRKLRSTIESGIDLLVRDNVINHRDDRGALRRIRQYDRQFADLRVYAMVDESLSIFAEI